MNVNEILELGKLGFSKDEIIGIMNAQNMSGLGQVTTPEQVTPGQFTTPGQDATSTALLTAINTLTATLQAGNISASGKAGSAPRTSGNVAEDLMKIMN